MKKVKMVKNINHLVTSILFVIVGLQMTDVELDARVTALEETSGTDPSNGKYQLFIINVSALSHLHIFQRESLN